MTTEAPSQQTEDRFADSIDKATEAVLNEFEWMGLPDDSYQRSDLMVEVNNAIAQIMRNWI